MFSFSISCKLSFSVVGFSFLTASCFLEWFLQLFDLITFSTFTQTNVFTYIFVLTIISFCFTCSSPVSVLLLSCFVRSSFFEFDKHNSGLKLNSYQKIKVLSDPYRKNNFLSKSSEDLCFQRKSKWYQPLQIITSISITNNYNLKPEEIRLLLAGDHYL